MTRAKMIENIKTLSMEDIRSLAGTRHNSSGIKPIIDAEQMKEGLRLCEYGKNSRKYEESLVYEPMSDEKDDNVTAPFWAKTYLNSQTYRYREAYGELIDRLLSFGGEKVVMPVVEHDYVDIITYGQFWFGKGAKPMKGVPCKCHANSSELWSQNKDKALICTGYALSKDGVWRQHSWLVWMKGRSNQIVETTVPRIAYYGVCLNYEKCEEFYEYNSF